MKYLTATILTIVSMIYLALASTVARIGMIAALVLTDPIILLALCAWVGVRP